MIINVNRTLVFAKKYSDSKVSLAHIPQDLPDYIREIYKTTGEKIARAQIKSALEEVFSLVRYANKYFDNTKPWKLITEDPEQCKRVIFACIQIIVNLANLLTPFLPNSCDKIRRMLEIERAVWDYTEIASNHSINKPEILFERIDKSRIEEEVKRLHE
jgi:methionyl-tRNA synthetase